MKLIPGKEKFETTSKNESWPQWNEEFTFPLRKETKQKFGKTKVVEEEISGSRFIVATLYAVLEDKPLIATEKKEEKTSSSTKESPKKGNKKKDGQGASSENQEPTKNKLLSQFFNKGSDKSADTTSTERKLFDKRRTVGATTISLDPKNFTSKPHKAKHPSDVSTGDMWKPLRPIASGISGAEDRVNFQIHILYYYTTLYYVYYTMFSFFFFINPFKTEFSCCEKNYFSSVTNKKLYFLWIISYKRQNILKFEASFTENIHLSIFIS